LCEKKGIQFSDASSSLSIEEKMNLYNSANKKVALLCNHQRTITTSQITSLSLMSTKIDILIEQKKELEKMRDFVEETNPDGDGGGKKKKKKKKRKRGSFSYHKKIASFLIG